jgi:hypothetical protein
MPLSATSKFLFLLETQGVVHSLFFGMLDYQTLASVARVSPFFEAAAIEVLYRTLDGLWPLLQLMPMDVADYPSYGFVSVDAPSLFVCTNPPVFQSFQEIAPEHWIRFARIAKRVRHVDWMEDAATICAECLEVASQQLHSKMRSPPQPLLPNLQSFRLHCTSLHGLHASLQWLSPSLEHLAVGVGSDLNGDIISFLTRAWAVCGGIRSFALSMDKTLPLSESLEMSCRLAEGMDSLELATLSLPLDLVSDILLESLSLSLHLQRLILSRSPSTLPLRTLNPHYHLSALQHLSLSGFMADLGELARAVGTSLRSIYIHAHSLQGASEMHLALRAIVDSCPLLQELTIHFEDIALHETATWMDLTALLRCHTLSRLVIQHPCPLPISNSLLSAMVHAWPEARYVSLNPRPPLWPWTPGWDSEILPTFDGLGAVAEAGGNLRHFGIYLGGDGGFTVRGDGSPRETLDELDLGWTDTELMEDLHPSFIRGLFPNAKIITD